MPIDSIADKFSVSKCRICNRLANGHHYGVLSCLRCKTFFRRSVLQNLTTECILPKRCSLKLCAGCRYRRCLDVGMSKKALQPKRDIIGIRKVPIPIASTFNESELNSLQFIHSLTSLDKLMRKKKFEAIRSKREAKKLADELRQRPEDGNLSLMAKADVSIVTQLDMIMMLEWSRAIPDFDSLPIADRLVLLKRFSSHHLVLENGYYTASVGGKDMWMISNGAYMPRNIDLIPDQIKRFLPEARLWRQEKLYKGMTEICIDDVVNPLKRLQISPEELLTLKIITLFNCGNHYNNSLFISEQSRQKAIEIKNRIIDALFVYYRSIDYPNFAERFGNVVLTLSGIFAAASTLLETYQIMRFFDFAIFDHISEQLLFNANEKTI